jgi:hypothetical protein
MGCRAAGRGKEKVRAFAQGLEYVLRRFCHGGHPRSPPLHTFKSCRSGGVLLSRDRRAIFTWCYFLSGGPFD